MLCLQSREECYSFFEDLCTVNELLSLSQRFEVAAMLKDGKTYLEIAEKTGASTATISRVNRSLNYGNDGYELVFGRMEKKGNGTRILNLNEIKQEHSKRRSCFYFIFYSSYASLVLAAVVSAAGVSVFSTVSAVCEVF